jgi:hypothetical protein
MGGGCGVLVFAFRVLGACFRRVDVFSIVQFHVEGIVSLLGQGFDALLAHFEKFF